MPAFYGLTPYFQAFQRPISLGVISFIVFLLFYVVLSLAANITEEKKAPASKITSSIFIGAFLSVLYAIPESLEDLCYLRAILFGLVTSVVIFVLSHRQTVIANIMLKFLVSEIAPMIEPSIFDDLKNIGKDGNDAKHKEGDE